MKLSVSFTTILAMGLLAAAHGAESSNPMSLRGDESEKIVQVAASAATASANIQANGAMTIRGLEDKDRKLYSKSYGKGKGYSSDSGKGSSSDSEEYDYHEDYDYDDYEDYDDGKGYSYGKGYGKGNKGSKGKGYAKGSKGYKGSKGKGYDDYSSGKGKGMSEPTKKPVREPTKKPAKEPTAEPTEEPVGPPTAEPTQEPVGPFCIDFDCGDGYLLRENPETRVGDDRDTCCFREGVCAGAPEGSPCTLGDIGSSLIPNPSFENFTSCPTTVSQLDLAVDWVQATSATSDYWVGEPSCDDSWRVGLGGIGMIPQNATDGDAFVGSIKLFSRDYYEYIGACLNSPLLAGMDYTFSLDVAAATDSSRYGGDTNGVTELLCIPDCNEFQISGSGYQGENYEVLATATPAGGLVGGGEWKSITFEVTPSQDCPAIMFGPGIDQNAQVGQEGTYVLYDVLNLQEGTAGMCNANGECVPVSSGSEEQERSQGLELAGQDPTNFYSDASDAPPYSDDPAGPVAVDP